MTQCYLKKDTPELSIIGGIGEFAAHLPALPIPESIANQYDTPEMRALGWVVTRMTDDHGPKAEPVSLVASFPGDEADN